MRQTLGLIFSSGFLHDRQFYAALTAAPLVLLLMEMWLPAWRAPTNPSVSAIVLMVLWRPVVEELLFRGVVQGWLAGKPGGRRHYLGLSGANLIASILFALAHLPYQPPLWAIAVLLPSLVFGYFRERHRHVYSAILLHGFYNACYLGAVLVGPQAR